MIIPAILERNFKDIQNKVNLIDKVSSTIQIDVVDNTIIEGDTFLDLKKLTQLKTKNDITIHFMVEDPLKYLKGARFFSLLNKGKIEGVSTIITQLINPDKLNQLIKFLEKNKYKIGLSINADEDTSLLRPYLANLDLIQFMGVTPGKQGNNFIPSVLDKIKRFKMDFPKVMTQIDGGVADYNFLEIIETGVDNIAIGSALFNTEDPKQKFLEFSKLFEEKRKTAHESTN